MLPLNTMQPVVRDKTPPTLVFSETIQPNVIYGTNTFESGLQAFDDGRDISFDIITKLGSLPNTFVEGGTVDVTFGIYDTGANYVEKTVSIPIIGSPKYLVPELYDFTAMSELPSSLTQTNGTWQLTDVGLQVSGEQPDSPRWNIVADGDGDADIQVEFIPMEAGVVTGIIARGQDLNNMFYIFYRDNIFSVTQRLSGVTTTHTSFTVEGLTTESVISLGVACDEDTLSVYNGADKIIEYKTEDFRYARQFGIISTSDVAIFQKMMIGNAGSISFGDYVAFERPVAVAGEVQTVGVGLGFQLDGSASYDPDGLIDIWEWTQVAGDTVELQDANTAMPRAVAPAQTIDGNLAFELKVTDQDGLESLPSVTQVNVVGGSLVRPMLAIKGGFMRYDVLDDVIFYQHSDNYIHCTVSTATESAIHPDNFPIVEYLMAEKGGDTIISLTLNNGITKVDDGFLIHVDDKLLGDNVLGKYIHQFVVHNINGDKLPPVFTGSVKVKSVIH